MSGASNTPYMSCMPTPFPQRYMTFCMDTQYLLPCPFYMDTTLLTLYWNYFTVVSLQHSFPFNHACILILFGVGIILRHRNVTRALHSDTILRSHQCHNTTLDSVIKGSSYENLPYHRVHHSNVPQVGPIVRAFHIILGQSKLFLFSLLFSSVWDNNRPSVTRRLSALIELP